MALRHHKVGEERYLTVADNDTIGLGIITWKGGNRFKPSSGIEKSS